MSTVDTITELLNVGQCVVMDDGISYPLPDSCAVQRWTKQSHRWAVWNLYGEICCELKRGDSLTFVEYVFSRLTRRELDPALPKW